MQVGHAVAGRPDDCSASSDQDKAVVRRSEEREEPKRIRAMKTTSRRKPAGQKAWCQANQEVSGVVVMVDLDRRRGLEVLPKLFGTFCFSSRLVAAPVARWLSF